MCVYVKHFSLFAFVIYALTAKVIIIRLLKSYMFNAYFKNVIQLLNLLL